MVRNITPTVARLDIRSAQPAVKRADPIYYSLEWRTLVAALIQQRGRICEDPRCDGRTHRPGMRVFGDHIKELKDNGAPFDPANIMLRCGASHSLKTAHERALRTARKH